MDRIIPAFQNRATPLPVPNAAEGAGLANVLAHGSAARPPQNEDEKAVIAKAKAILMERWGMTEGQAHRFLQKKSMDARVKLIQTAQLIVDDR